MKFNINTIVLEGPDCSGKTTVYSELHKKTKFKWNIHDRSTLSMLCYAIQYGRDTTHWREKLREEINNLNNVFVVLLPPLGTILKRLNTRGDEFQTADSVTKLYSIFESEVERIKELPNVFVCTSSNLNIDDLAEHIHSYERSSYEKLGNTIESHVKASNDCEQINLQFSWSDNTFKMIDSNALLIKKEVDYYNKTRDKFIKKIQNEKAGLNEYELKQTQISRRFVMTQDTCISFIQAIARNGNLYITTMCRSAEVSEIFKCDLHFIASLGKIAKELIADNTSSIETVYFNVTIGSAHIIKA